MARTFETTTFASVPSEEATPPKLNDLAPDASAPLCRAIHKLLRKKPAERYQSADELLATLAKIDPKAVARGGAVLRGRPAGAKRPAPT